MSQTIELKSVVEALLFSAHKPLPAREIASILQAAAEASPSGSAATFKNLRESGIGAAIEQLKTDYIKQGRSFQIEEVAGGFQVVSLPEYATWLKELFDESRAQRLSIPALETLAIIAYRQPIIRADIESVRGVSVDGILKMLLERGLIRIVGRSEHAGRPMLYGSTQAFLEHFGLRDLTDLPKVDELRKMESRPLRSAAAQTQASTAVDPPSLIANPQSPLPPTP